VEVFSALVPDWKELVLETAESVFIQRRGFRREAILATMKMMRVKKRKRPAVLQGVRIMEVAALAELAHNRRG
jgi:hypothetical protein